MPAFLQLRKWKALLISDSFITKKFLELLKENEWWHPHSARWLLNVTCHPLTKLTVKIVRHECTEWNQAHVPLSMLLRERIIFSKKSISSHYSPYLCALLKWQLKSCRNTFSRKWQTVCECYGLQMEQHITYISVQSNDLYSKVKEKVSL